METKSEEIGKAPFTERPQIGIIEIYSHHVFVYTLVQVCLRCGYDVTVYSVPRIYKDLVPLFGDQLDSVNWVIADAKEGDYQFLRRIKPQIESQLDLLFINSVQGYRVGLFYLVNFAIKTIVGAGRISEFFGVKYQIFGHETFRKFAHHNYSKFFLGRCIPRYKGIIVHTDQAGEFAIEHGYNRIIHQMPFSLYEPVIVGDDGDDSRLNFCITGSMVSYCRDHHGALDAFERLWEAGYLDAELTILSSPKSDYGRGILERMKGYESRGFPIKYYDGWIAEEEYLDAAGRADFFLSPLMLDYYSCGELTSGIVEAIRQGTPGIYPQSYLPDKSLESCSLFYQSINELDALVVALLQDRQKVADLKTLALTGSEQYAVENVAAEFKKRIDPVLAG